ncbi:hypothetical protein M9H77_20434 [Catharanthus roseus]|uniref:Uncharacterized protein n=1 Tax=Catharanthus roseus TaxID=4058 RepID=A0ACC0ANQ3_CATRO|nr:hypothetical protein M9H77_20434 [Catharanthus roseus]
MDSILTANFRLSPPLPTFVSAVDRPLFPLLHSPSLRTSSIRRPHFAEYLRPAAAAPLYADSGTTNSMPLHPKYALETLVDKRITGFPVIDDDWKLVGVVSDYDLLALDSISGCIQSGFHITLKSIRNEYGITWICEHNIPKEVHMAWERVPSSSVVSHRQPPGLSYSLRKGDKISISKDI